MNRHRLCIKMLVVGFGTQVPVAVADVLYSSGINSAPAAVVTLDGTYGGRGIGDDYNTGYVSINITGLRFYGGLVGANDSLFIDFYDLSDVRAGTITPFSSDVMGTGLHTLRPETFGDGNASFLPGIGSIIFAPLRFNVPLDPADPPRVRLGFAGAPIVGGNDPSLSAEGFDTDPRIVRAAYAPVALQYAQVEITGTGNNPAWAKPGSGTWPDSTSWTMGVPNGVTGAASFLGAITADSTVTLSANQTVGFVAFDNANRYTLAGPGTLTLAAQNNVPAKVYVNSGTHTITAPLAYTSGVLFTTAGDSAPGAASLTLPLNTSATGTLTKAGAGTLAFAAPTGGIVPLALPAITINGGTVALGSHASHANRTLLKTSSLTINGGALDLGANDMILLGGGSGGAAAIRMMLQQGFANGTWGGTGIVSSAAAALPTTAIGYMLNATAGGNAIYATFDGTSVSSDDVLLKYTLKGDANLDGTVNFADLLTLAKNYNQTTGQTYSTGDFNYDGTVNFSDLLGLAKNYGVTLSSLSAGPGTAFATDWARAMSLVPEPASLGALCVATLSLLRRRR